MAYAYWTNWKHCDRAVFDLFFRKNPFGGEFTLFAGLEECLKFIKHFHFTDSDIEYLRSVMPSDTKEEFFGYLKSLTCKDVVVYAIAEGTVVFPRVPIMRVEGPLPVVQLLETTFLSLINYASLVATNAARYRMAAGNNAKLIEFGLRRAQGPDGGISGSRYTFMGGFDATSNVLAGQLFGIPVSGTHGHAFVNSFCSLDDVKSGVLCPKDDKTNPVKILDICLTYRAKVAKIVRAPESEMNDSELAAFTSYAISFPNDFLALIDTYSVVSSGLPNFVAVALALNHLGYKAKGVRIDSGDLAYLSIRTHHVFKQMAKEFNVPWFSDMVIVASNNISEETLISLNQQDHNITTFGIGTNLVTCYSQPALGCVFKLVKINSSPCIKLSQDVEKVTMPGRKDAYRLFSRDGCPLVDLLQMDTEAIPKTDEKILCQHPFQASKRVYVKPARVEPLYKLYWENNQLCQPLPSLREIRDYARESLKSLRQDHKRALNPTPYKVSVSESLYTYIHTMWNKNAPIGELS
ncbi:nicotinate phosphoribosyltransferase-like [Oscarella lobularis]|uniref:nicotinate phosphoribosyltransferase-like n=1 Tax=Oscarella lobularis TaxID=121494 RepID=UPI003313E804